MGPVIACKLCLKPGQPKSKWTCPCGFGYWDARAQEFISGDRVRRGEAISRQEYEGHLRQCASCARKAEADDILDSSDVRQDQENTLDRPTQRATQQYHDWYASPAVRPDVVPHRRTSQYPEPGQGALFPRSTRETPSQPTYSTSYDIQDSFNQQGLYYTQDPSDTRGSYRAPDSYKTEGSTSRQGSDYTQDSSDTRGSYRARDSHNTEGSTSRQGSYYTQDPSDTRGTYRARDSYNTESSTSRQGSYYTQDPSNTRASHSVSGSYDVQGQPSTTRAENPRITPAHRQQTSNPRHSAEPSSGNRHRRRDSYDDSRQLRR